MPGIVSSTKLPKHFIYLLSCVRCRREDEKEPRNPAFSTPALNSNDYDFFAGGGAGKKRAVLLLVPWFSTVCHKVHLKIFLIFIPSTQE